METIASGSVSVTLPRYSSCAINIGPSRAEAGLQVISETPVTTSHFAPIQHGPIRQLGESGVAKSVFIRALLAISISTLAVFGSIAFEGRLIFNGVLSRLSADPICTIEGVSDVDGTDSVVVDMLMTSPTDLAPLQRKLCAYEGPPPAPSFRRLPLRIRPFLTAVDRQGQVFISTEEGSICSTHIKAQSDVAEQVGSHELRAGQFITCSEDGAIIIAATNNITIAWSSVMRAVLWRRADVTLNCGTFVSDTYRFFAGVETGEVLEIDGRTGDTVRQVVGPSHWLYDLSVSPCGNYCLTMTNYSSLTVVDAHTGRVLWRRDCTFNDLSRNLAGAARFLHSGTTMVVALTDKQDELTIVSSRTGDVIRTLAETSKIRGLHVARDGTIYSWNYWGVLTAWDPRCGAVKHRYYPGRDWAALTRKERGVIHRFVERIAGVPFAIL
jgi:hypothetical protein